MDAGGTGLALTEGTDEELWRLPNTGDPIKVWSGPAGQVHPSGPVAVDGVEVWLSSSSSNAQWAIYHYSPGGGLEQVAHGSGSPPTVAGACA